MCIRDSTFSVPSIIRVRPKPNGLGIGPYVAVTGTGAMVLAWSDATRVLVTSSTDGGTTFSDAKQIADPTLQSLSSTVTADASGNVVVWWPQVVGKVFDFVIGRGVSLESLRHDVATFPAVSYTHL